MNKLKENLKNYRTSFKMTQKELAEKIGVSTNNIGHWEKGRTQPDIDTLIKLAEIFNITVDELIND